MTVTYATYFSNTRIIKQIVIIKKYSFAKMKKKTKTKTLFYIYANNKTLQTSFVWTKKK